MTATTRYPIIRTRIPARLDRLPWSRFHWRVVAGLGTVWILDGLQVTIVGSIGSRLTDRGSGIHLTAGDIGTAGALYVAGACIGALLFGQLTDRRGRKKLMVVTLAVYIVATVVTTFATVPWYFFLCRFVTGAGIGGEYAAVNSAIDELIPARNRGQVDITINGSYWVGAAAGGMLGLVFLDQSLFPLNVGWRLSFAVGAVLGLGILLVRRSLPESPRWLFLHGRVDEAERIVSEIEAEVQAETGVQLSDPGEAIVVRQRGPISFREIARIAIRYYPNRAVLGMALFIGQAFLYNAVTFDLGTLLHRYFGVSSGAVPGFMVIFAAGNFFGPFLLGRLFDTVGRKPMIAGTYLISAALTVLLAVLFAAGELNQWGFIGLVGVTFFFASAGASSAYLTVSEIFPMEMRALAIAFFFALGTAVGGITGPLVFGAFIDSGHTTTVAIGFYIGAAAMALGGVAELVFGVRAERTSLENIAAPISAMELPPTEAGPAATTAQPAVEWDPRALERDERIRRRVANRMSRQRRGLARFRPGPGNRMYSPGMVGTASHWAPRAELDRDREIGEIVRAVQLAGAVPRDQLALMVGARYWGPGRFDAAVREAADEGQIELQKAGVAPSGDARPRD
jgi:MFS family permease